MKSAKLLSILLLWSSASASAQTAAPSLEETIVWLKENISRFSQFYSAIGPANTDVNVQQCVLTFRSGRVLNREMEWRKYEVPLKEINTNSIQVKENATRMRDFSVQWEANNGEPFLSTNSENATSRTKVTGINLTSKSHAERVADAIKYAAILCGAKSMF